MFVPVSPPALFKELADACNAESDDMEMKFMSILCTRSVPHLRRGKKTDDAQLIR